MLNALLKHHYRYRLSISTVFPDRGATLFFPPPIPVFVRLPLSRPRLSRGHPRRKRSGDAAGRAWSVLCACAFRCVLTRVRAKVLRLEEGAIEGGMEGAGVKEGRGGPQGRQWRADRRCSDTRRLEEPHIFSVIPGGQRYVRAPACAALPGHERARTRTHTAERYVNAHAISNC